MFLSYKRAKRNYIETLNKYPYTVNSLQLYNSNN